LGDRVTVYSRIGCLSAIKVADQFYHYLRSITQGAYVPQGFSAHSHHIHHSGED